MDTGDYIHPYEAEFHEYNDEDDTDFEEVNRHFRNDDDTETSLSTYKKKQRNLWNSVNSTDKNYHKVKKVLNDKKTEIGIYSTSNTPGTMIRDAIHGSACSPFRVGSKDEDLFFKVKIATGEVGGNSETFFFDSPEQYERHLHGTIAQPIKEKWTNKFALAQKIM